MSERIDCVVIGAGVVGLAVARALAEAGREVIVLEKEASFGTGVSARNSEVIHAGLYYPPDSLKASLCVRGKALLYRYLEERAIPHRRCGKLVVACNHAQDDMLETISANALLCGVNDLELLSASDAQTLEPELKVTRALLSPSSGIVDSHALMTSLLGDAERRGAVLAVRSEVAGGTTCGDRIRLRVAGDSTFELEATSVVNAAGLGAQQVARVLGLDQALIPERLLAKGNYFALGARNPFQRLIYPVPESGGLGVHLTLDLAGQAKFGPDVQWVDQVDFNVDSSRRDAFVERIRAYWPAVDAAKLTPAYAGIRPKLAGSADFMMAGPAQHGVAGLVNLFGIESPGLTASLAIAERVAAELGK